MAETVAESPDVVDQRDDLGTSASDPVHARPRDERGSDGLVMPKYEGACIANVVPALAARSSNAAPSWLPAPVAEADQVVLLVLDGLGFEQLEERQTLAPTISSGVGGPATSVAPSTTAAALTSISTGLPPSRHGILGYRLKAGRNVKEGRRGDVLNVLRWQIGDADARQTLPPLEFQPLPAFHVGAVPVVTRSEFGLTGFSAAHLQGALQHGWRVPSTLVVEVRRLLSAGERFIYAYYDGIDKVAHEHGLGEHFDAEVVAVDRLVGDLIAVLPRGGALLLVADHGQVEVPDQAIVPDAEIMRCTDLISGEGRFRWLHARKGAETDLLDTAKSLYGDVAWVRSRAQVLDEGWLGGALRAEFEDRLGDVVLAAREPVAFADPADTGESLLRARHGSLTSAEMLVPMMGYAAS